jgi:DNA-binding NtrC family response regulator
LPVKILLVDDDQDILTIMKKALSSFPVTAFSDPKAAYNAIKNNPTGYSILITDLRMPGMTGFELAREAKKNHPNILIILMTGFEIKLSEFGLVFPSTRVDALVKKPFRLEELQSTVADMIMKLPADSTGHDRGQP